MQRILGLSILALVVLDLTSCGDNGEQTGPQSQVASVTVTPGELTLLVGESQQLTATAQDQAGNPLVGRSITWATTEPTVATVSAAGVVNGVGPGSATITATSEGKSGSATVSVAIPVASVTVSPGELTLLVGESQQLTAITRDEAGNPLDGRSITWTTTEPTVATVSATGIVTGVGTGSATVTATSEGKSASATVSVASAPVVSVTVSPGELTLLVGASQQLTAITRDQAGNPLVGRSVTWATTEPTVAIVSATGIVTGVGAGSATITATSEGKNGSAAVSVISSVIFASVAAGGAHTCALTTSGAAYCWGRGESGQLGVQVPTTTCMTDGDPFPCSMVPLAVGVGLAFAQLAGGGAHTCGLTSDGSAYCWGSNASGQLGDNSTTNREAPVPVATGLKFASIDAGAQHTCGLTNDGTAYCWGRNNRGQLGDGTTTDRSVPVAVTGGHTFQLIAAGGFAPAGAFSNGHTCALTSSGTAYCWGDNERGQLGNGMGGFGEEDLTAHPVPAPVSGELTFAALTAGLGRHTCGLTGAGSAYCWGENTFGALGNGSTSDSPIPVPVSGGLAFVQLIAGGFIGHTCGLTASGTAYCWGENERGQVGDRSTVDRLEPSAVAGGLSFTRLDAGFRHTCGRATTGTVYCWGSGGAGQLGTNSTSQRAVPTKVLGQP
jgi:alpha-tubulin suppressor-like RCC1 family protein